MRSVYATWSFATALGLLAAVPLAGCGGGEGDGGGKQDRASGPVAALYVIDHLGSDPAPGELAPYTRAFKRVRAGCAISAGDLANQVLHLSDQASKGSGTPITNLEILRGLVRHVGTTPKDCTDTFVLVEARLEGGSLG